MEHNPIVLDGIASLISNQPEMKLVGTARTAEAAMALYQDEKPDVTLVDLDLGQRGGVRLIQRIRALEPTAFVIGIVTYELDISVVAAMASGAAAIVAKDQVAETLPQLILSMWQP